MELSRHDPAAACSLERQLDDHLCVLGSVRGHLDGLSALSREICDRFDRGGFLYSFGNGGSAADAQHLVGELIGRFRRERRGLPAITLSTDPTVTTCIGNDYGFEEIFERQLLALARPDDVIVAFTTSGRSANVVAGLRAGEKSGALTVLFTGRGQPDGGPASEFADRVFAVESADTARVQEAHVLMLHLLSDQIDHWASTTG